jgi:hypothetical protein
VAEKSTLLGCLFTVTIYKFEITELINYKHFVNMNGTIYGNRLPRGYASAESLGTTVVHDSALSGLPSGETTHEM